MSRALCAISFLLVCAIDDAVAQSASDLNWKPLFGNALINGRLVQIEAAKSEVSPKEKLAQIKTAWKSGGFHVIQENKNGWDMISRFEHGTLEVIRAKASAAGTYLMRHRLSVTSPVQTTSPPNWLTEVGRVQFSTSTADAFQSGNTWLVDISDNSSASQIIDQIVVRTKSLGYQVHPIFSKSKEFSTVALDNGSAAQVVLSAEGGKQLQLQVVPGRAKPMLLVTQVQSFKSIEPAK